MNPHRRELVEFWFMLIVGLGSGLFMAAFAVALIAVVVAIFQEVFFG